jgi:adenylyltransferase/sulfurtransferase
VVVDGCDNLPTRYLVDDACSLAGLPWVYGSIYRFEGQVSVFNYNGGPCYRDLFSTAPPAESVPSCSEGGVLGVLPGVIGSLQANEALKLIIGFGNPLIGRLLLYDAETMKFNELTFGRDEDRNPITSLENVSAMFAEPQWCIVADPRRTVEEGDASTIGTMFQSISMADFISRRTDGWSPFILDVRSLMEFQQGHVASCNHQVAHDSVVSSIAQLPTDNDILVHCKSGMRSQIAAMLLIQAGMDGSKLYNLEGGILAWQSALPEEIVQ